MPINYLDDPNSQAYKAADYFQKAGPNPQLLQLLAQARAGQDVTNGLTPQSQKAFEVLKSLNNPNPTPMDSLNQGYANAAFAK